MPSTPRRSGPYVLHHADDGKFFTGRDFSENPDDAARFATLAAVREAKRETTCLTEFDTLTLAEAYALLQLELPEYVVRLTDVDRFLTADGSQTRNPHEAERFATLDAATCIADYVTDAEVLTIREALDEEIGAEPISEVAEEIGPGPISITGDYTAEAVEAGRLIVRRIDALTWDLGRLLLTTFGPSVGRGQNDPMADKVRRFADDIGLDWTLCARHRVVATAWHHVMLVEDDMMEDGFDVVLEPYFSPELPWSLHRMTRSRPNRATELAVFADLCRQAEVKPTQPALREWLARVDAGDVTPTVRVEPTQATTDAVAARAPQAAQEPSVPSTRPHAPVTPNVAPIARLVASLESQWERQGCPHDADLAAQLRRLASLMDVTS
jgi:hypothetical protein